MNAMYRKQTKATVLPLRAEAHWDRFTGVLLGFFFFTSERNTATFVGHHTTTFKLFGPNTSTSLLDYFFWPSSQ